MAYDQKGKKLPKGIVQRKDGLYMGRFQYEGETYPAIYDPNLKVVEKKLEDLRYEVTHAKSQCRDGLMNGLKSTKNPE